MGGYSMGGYSLGGYSIGADSLGGCSIGGLALTVTAAQVVHYTWVDAVEISKRNQSTLMQQPLTLHWLGWKNDYQQVVHGLSSVFSYKNFGVNLLKSLSQRPCRSGYPSLGIVPVHKGYVPVL